MNKILIVFLLLFSSCAKNTTIKEKEEAIKKICQYYVEKEFMDQLDLLVFEIKNKAKLKFKNNEIVNIENLFSEHKSDLKKTSNGSLLSKCNTLNKMNVDEKYKEIQKEEVLQDCLHFNKATGKKTKCDSWLNNIILGDPILRKIEKVL